MVQQLRTGEKSSSPLKSRRGIAAISGLTLALSLSACGEAEPDCSMPVEIGHLVLDASQAESILGGDVPAEVLTLDSDNLVMMNLGISDHASPKQFQDAQLVALNILREFDAPHGVGVTPVWADDVAAGELGVATFELPKGC